MNEILLSWPARHCPMELRKLYNKMRLESRKVNLWKVNECEVYKLIERHKVNGRRVETVVQVCPL